MYQISKTSLSEVFKRLTKSNMTKNTIKCFDPDITEADITAASKVIESRILAFGPNVEKFENLYSSFSKKKNNIGFNSASSAAYLLFQYLYEINGPCRVYTPSIAFVSPVFAAIKNHHEVCFIDVDENLLIDAADLKKKFINDNKTSIVMPILYGGVSTIGSFEEETKDLKFTLVIDSAHCISPTMNYDYAFYSFHPVKPICMSNGGLLATDHTHASEYMKSGRNFGRKITGDTYDLVQSGFNFYMNNLNAALGLSQIQRSAANVAKRRENFEFLRDNIPSDLGYFTSHDDKSSYYLSTLVLKEEYSSAIMRKSLIEKDIQASFHYPFLHKTEYYRSEVSLPNTDSMEDKIINLPIHQNLTKKDLERIINECIHYSRSGRQSRPKA